MSGVSELPLEIVCEIVKFLDIDDINKFENALKITLPNYIFIPGYRKIFKQSIDKIIRIGYTEYAPNKISYRYFGCQDINNKRHGMDCNELGACNECSECTTYTMYNDTLNIFRNGGRYRRSGELSDLTEINPTEFAKRVKIDACTDKNTNGKINHSFRIN